MTKTTFAGESPWAGLEVPETRRTVKEHALAPRQKPPQAVKPVSKKKPVQSFGDVEITNDKPKPRKVPESKYEALFAALKPGQSIKCDARHAHAIANALRSWQRRRGLGWTTAMTLDYGDGFGRVFRVK